MSRFSCSAAIQTIYYNLWKTCVLIRTTHFYSSVFNLTWVWCHCIAMNYEGLVQSLVSLHSSLTLTDVLLYHYRKNRRAIIVALQLAFHKQIKIIGPHRQLHFIRSTLARLWNVCHFTLIHSKFKCEWLLSVAQYHLLYLITAGTCFSCKCCKIYSNWGPEFNQKMSLL